MTHKLVYYLPSPPGPDRTIALSGALTGPLPGGVLITRPGEVVPELRALLFHRPALNAAVAELDGAKDVTWQDRLDAIGDGSLVLGNEDADLTYVWGQDCAVRFELNGRAAFTMLIDDVEHVAIAGGEEHDQVTTLAGHAHIGVLAEAVVYPARGCDRKPWGESRVFSWASLDFDDAGWGRCDPLVTQAPGALQFPGGGTRPPLIAGTGPNGSYWEHGVDPEWPDTGAWWIWAHWPDSRESAPAGPCYFRKWFTVPDDPAIVGLYVYAVLDGAGDVYLDGELVLSCDYGQEPSAMWSQEVEIGPGEHVVAVYCENDIDPENDGIQNPGGVLLSAYGTNASSEWYSIFPLVHTDETWKIVEYPPTPPGMTVGECIRIVVTEAQARGVYPEVTFAFTDEVDSAGVPWAETNDISTKIGTDTWVFIGEELASTYCDVWMAPGDFTLYAWARGGRGRDRNVTFAGVADETDPASGNLAGLTHHTVR